MDGQAIRVATFNIHHGVGRDGRLDLRRTADVIRRFSADLIALQEIDRGLERSGRTDQVRELEERTGISMYFHAALSIDGGDYGIALGSRDRLETSARTLPHVGDEERRIAITSRWRGINVVTTHVSRDRRARRSQIGALARIVADLEAPVLVLGDLNERWAGLGPLRDASLVPALAGPRLLRPWRAGTQIDHVLIGPGLRIRAATRPRSNASDHLPLVADIRGPRRGT